MCANNYLGLSNHPEVVEAALAACPQLRRAAWTPTLQGAGQGAEQGAGQGAGQGDTNICIPSGANMSDYVTCYHPNQTRPGHK